MEIADRRVNVGLTMRTGQRMSRWFALAAVSAGLVMMVLPLQAQEGDRIAQQFLNNVVQLTTTFSNGSIKDGFGFVIGERANLLYVVTARHDQYREYPGSRREKMELSLGFADFHCTSAPRADAAPPPCWGGAGGGVSVDGAADRHEICLDRGRLFPNGADRGGKSSID